MNRPRIRTACQADLDLLWDFLAIAVYEPDAVPLVPPVLRYGSFGPPRNLQPRYKYNMAPTDTVDVIRSAV